MENICIFEDEFYKVTLDKVTLAGSVPEGYRVTVFLIDSLGILDGVTDTVQLVDHTYKDMSIARAKFNDTVKRIIKFS